LSPASEKIKVFYLDNIIILNKINDKIFALFQSFIRDVYGLKLDINWGCLVGHPYIASLWLGFPFEKRSCLKGVLRCSMALFCLLPSYIQASENSVNKGFKVPFVILRAHSRV